MGVTSSIRIALALALASWLDGCAVAPVVYEYPHLPSRLRVEVHDQVRTNHLCRGVTTSDSGHIVMRGTDFAGCFIPPALIIVSAWHETVIYHELCHASGRSPSECSEVH